MIYLDNNASTPIDPEALEEIHRVQGAVYGNPGSRHIAGRKARQVLEDARESIAAILGARPQELIFTSGGTESNNIAIHGFTTGRSGAILLPSGEHPSIEEPIKRLVKSGWERRDIPLQSDGLFTNGAVASLNFFDARLATALLANNETGVIQSLDELSECCAGHAVPFHIDAVQAVGKIPVNFRETGATTLSFGAHKFHGPRGIGGLLIKKGVEFPALTRGGFQESGVRPGTEAIALAAGMNVALRNWAAESEQRAASTRSLRDKLQQGLLQSCAPAIVNGHLEKRLPGTLNISFPRVDGDGLLIALDLAGICCSLGSACASGSIEPSPVLLAMGLPSERYSSALRLSLSAHNTEAEIDEAITIIAKAVHRLRTY